MCYDIRSQLESQLKYAKRYTPELVPEILEKLRPHLDEHQFSWHHASGFIHPHLLIYTSQSFPEPVPAQWGLIPHWSKDLEKAKKFWNNTLNARGETIFEKPSFRDAAKHSRCLIVVDGFFEHHHFNNNSYPFYIHKKDGLITLGGLHSEWVDKDTGEVYNTFTIVTTKGNDLLSLIHNNPKLKEPRMPVILEDDQIENWLNTELGPKELEALIQPAHFQLHAKPVKKLRGKDYVGNEEEVIEKYEYQALKEDEALSGIL